MDPDSGGVGWDEEKGLCMGNLGSNLAVEGGHSQQILTNPKWPIGKSQFSLGRCPRTRIAFAFPHFGGADARYMAIEIAHKKAPRPAFDELLPISWTEKSVSD